MSELGGGKKKKIKIKQGSYINKTVMEVETKQRSTHALLLLHCGLNHSFDGWQSFGTHFVIKIRRQGCREICGGKTKQHKGIETQEAA